MKKTTLLRNALKKPGLLIVPMVYDALMARCVEAVGFKVAFMTGAGFRRAVLGEPDIGIATMTEAIANVKLIANAVNIPLIADMDDGFGHALHAYRTTQEMIRAGGAGMFISDRKPAVHPSVENKPGGHALVECYSKEEYLGKMGAVLEARDSLDKDFVVIARLDSGALLGDEEVLARAKACVKLGVDVILPHFIPAGSKFGIRDKETMKRLHKKIGAPDVLIWGMGPPGFTAKDYEDVGAKLWVHGSPPFVKVALEYYQEFHDKRALPKVGWNSPLVGPAAERYHKLEGLDFWSDIEKKYMK